MNISMIKPIGKNISGQSNFIHDTYYITDGKSYYDTGAIGRHNAVFRIIDSKVCVLLKHSKLLHSQSSLTHLGMCIYICIH